MMFSLLGEDRMFTLENAFQMQYLQGKNFHGKPLAIEKKRKTFD